MNDSIDDTAYLRVVTAGRIHSCRYFERDVMPFCGVLHRYALAYTQNLADAEDLVQETLLKAYKAFDKVDEDTHFKAWLLTIMRNAWISNHRAAMRRPAERLVAEVAEDQTASAARASAQIAYSAEHTALRNVMDADVRQAVLELSEEMRRTIFFVAIEGMKCREVAEIMGVSPSTVASRLHRCRLYLRRALADVARQRRPLNEPPCCATGVSDVTTEDDLVTDARSLHIPQSSY